jgi:hypothetical protein
MLLANKAVLEPDFCPGMTSELPVTRQELGGQYGSEEMVTIASSEAR